MENIILNVDKIKKDLESYDEEYKRVLDVESVDLVILIHPDIVVMAEDEFEMFGCQCRIIDIRFPANCGYTITTKENVDALIEHYGRFPLK